MASSSSTHRPSAALAGTAAYLLASVAWGLNIPLSGELLKSFDPFWLTPWRQLLSALLLGAWVLVTLGASQLRSPIGTGRALALGALVSAFLILFNLGLKLSHPLTVAAVIAGSPVYAAVVTRLMTGARLERGFWGATALTLLGAGIALQGHAAGGLGWRGGELLVVVAVACWTVYSMLTQRWFSADVPQLRRTYLAMVAAVPCVTVAWAVARAVGLVGPPNLQPTASDLGNLLLAAGLCSALATVAWNNGVARLGIQTGAIWQNMVPVFAVLISLLVYGIQPRPQQLLGGAVVLAGVVYMQWHKRRSAADATAATAQGAQSLKS